MSKNPALSLRLTVFSSLFTALIVIGGYISFPLPFSPVPIVLSDFFVMLAGLFLGASWGGASVGLFIFLGILGLPVFAGGKAGLAVLFGPTGGFLLGYFIGVFVIGWVSERGQPSVVKYLAALISGNGVIYGIGVPVLKMALKLTWGKAVGFGLLPFLPGMVIKIIVAIIVIRTLPPFLKNNSSGSDGK